MRNFLPLLTGLGLLLIIGATPAVGQNLRNDGFHRRNGQMHILRNGQLRPMTRDARLPTGAVVTKDGFIQAVNGTRTELREGQGCDFKGNIVAVVPAAGGGLALDFPTRGQRRSAAAPTVVQATLEDLFGRRSEEEYEREDDDNEYDKKSSEQTRERRKKEEEWLRESQKKREEQNREQGKKWKEKWKKGKGWDD